MINVMNVLANINAINVSPATGDEFPMGAVIAVIAVSGLLLAVNIIMKFLNKK